MVLHTRVVSGTGGGPEKTILNSPRFLIGHGYNAICAYMHPPGDPGFEDLRKKAQLLDAPLIALEDRGPWDASIVKRMLKVCRDNDVAIWHGHDYKSNALGLLLRPFWPMRLVTTVHGWVKFTRRTPLYYWIDRLCLRHYDRVICVSEDLHEECLAARVPAERCLFIHNAIDTEQYTRQTPVEEAKRRLGFDPGRFLLGAVGRLSDEKNLQGLIRAVDELLGEGRDLDLIIVGEGDARADLENMISRLHRGDRIRLLGYRSDTRELYEAMDALVLNSLREGLPNVVLEAMAMEVPVLATRIAGIPRLIEHDTNGLLIDAGDCEQLGQCLRRLQDRPELRRQLALSGRDTIEQSYSFAVRMKKVRAVYDDVLGRSAAASHKQSPHRGKVACPCPKA